VWPRDRSFAPAAAEVRNVIRRILAEQLYDNRLHGRLIGTTYKKR